MEPLDRRDEVDSEELAQLAAEMMETLIEAELAETIVPRILDRHPELDGIDIETLVDVASAVIEDLRISCEVRVWKQLTGTEQ